MKDQNKEELVITRVFDAPTERVWQAWTNPEHMKKWWGPKEYSCPDCEIDLRVGGKYLYSMLGPDGKKIWVTGIYKEIIPNRKLVFSDSFGDDKGNIVPSEDYGMQGMPLEMLVTVILDEEDGKTKMTMTHAGIPAGEHREGANAGWNSSFDKLEELLKQMQY
jgi:uncharacterized protein YndB with AHSA1/START domain